MSGISERVDGGPAAAATTAAAEAVSLQQFASILLPLAALWLVIDRFGLESIAVSRLVLVTCLGFSVHYFLPLRYRLPFFLLLSIAALGLVLGVLPAAWILGIGLALVGLCHLPATFRTRLVAVGVAAVLVALGRAAVVHVPVPASVWPILGSLFMFRLIVYLYDIRHDPKLAGFWPSLSYFFLLPNVCFPLFPVVDFKTFRTTYYSGDRHAIYAGGLQWIFRGVVQLLLYRLVYQTLVIQPTAVATAWDLGQYFVWPFLLYFRVSGQFHLVIGLLRLFGFNLPETHHEYFLASSFTDFWRRINIYWKDFMMKLFYYPAYFALRRRGPLFALVVSTVIVFAATWFLHSYQWFWLRGVFQFGWTDAVFWSVLGVVVVFNSLHEWRRGRARALTARALSWPETLGVAARTLGMFCFISVLWSLWSTESIGAWLSLWPAIAHWSPGPSGTALAAFAVPAGVALVAIAKGRRWAPGVALSQGGRAILVVLVCACLVVGSAFRAAPYLGPVGRVMMALRSGGLNQADAVALERGYYENLMGVDRFNGELWALYMNRPLDWGGTLLDEGLARPLNGFVPYELRPSASGRFKGVTLRTNVWGMHDKEYARTAPAGCQRIALLGASHAMGSGVERDRTFEALVEDRLNREQPGRCVELLNFAVYGYSPLYQLQILDERVLGFDPDVILYVGHPEDSLRVVRLLTQLVRDRKPLPYEFLRRIVQEAEVTADQSERVVSQRLAPFRERILGDLYAAMMGDARQRGMCGGFVFLPMVPEMSYAVDVAREKQLAGDAGFTVLDLTGVYDVPDRNGLWIAPWDAHPNAKGHALVAQKLYSLLTGERSLLACRASSHADPASRNPVTSADAAARRQPTAAPAESGR
jgi:alginate O-acetyltransferase complex protein AlgI